MKSLRPLLFALACALPAAPALVQAQQATTAPRVSDSHARFYYTILAGADQEQILDTLVQEVTAQMLASNPDYILLEEEYPGLGADLILAIKPIIRSYRERAMAQYAPRFIDAAREIFTAEEAEQLADFYGSPVGRRLMQAISANVSVSQRIEPALDEAKISQGAIARDDAATMRDTLGDLTSADLAEIAAFSARTPASARLGEYSQRTMPIRLQMENEPPNAAELAELERVVVAFMEERLARK